MVIKRVQLKQSQNFSATYCIINKQHGSNNSLSDRRVLYRTKCIKLPKSCFKKENFQHKTRLLRSQAVCPGLNQHFQCNTDFQACVTFPTFQALNVKNTATQSHARIQPHMVSSLPNLQQI